MAFETRLTGDHHLTLTSSLCVSARFSSPVEAYAKNHNSFLHLFYQQNQYNLLIFIALFIDMKLHQDNMCALINSQTQLKKKEKNIHAPTVSFTKSHSQ